MFRSEICPRTTPPSPSCSSLTPSYSLARTTTPTSSPPKGTNCADKAHLNGLPLPKPGGYDVPRPTITPSSSPHDMSRRMAGLIASHGHPPPFTPTLNYWSRPPQPPRSRRDSSELEEKNATINLTAHLMIQNSHNTPPPPFPTPKKKIHGMPVLIMQYQDRFGRTVQNGKLPWSLEKNWKGAYKIPNKSRKEGGKAAIVQSTSIEITRQKNHRCETWKTYVRLSCCIYFDFTARLDFLAWSFCSITTKNSQFKAWSFCSLHPHGWSNSFLPTE